MECFICGKHVLNLSHMQAHVSAKHDTLTFSKFVCKQDKCCRQFSSVRSLYKHIKKQHVIKNAVDKKENSGSVEQSNSSELNTDEIDPANENTACTPSTELIDTVELKEDNSSNLKSANLTFILKLYSNLNFTRKDVIDIIENTSLLFEARDGPNNDLLEMKSEFLIKKELIKQGLFLEPETLVCGYHEYNIRSKSKTGDKIQSKAITGQYISLNRLVKALLETNLLQTILDYMNEKIHQMLCMILKMPLLARV